MKLNRRSVLGAIGMIGVGTGAAFGSGAFTTVEAQRQVEVNVIGSSYISDGVIDLNDNPSSEPTDQEEGGEDVADIEDDIANAILGESGTADVLVNTESSNVTVKGNGSDGNTYDGRSLFPVFDGTYDTVDRNYVSLVANDVTIVFGPEGRELPQNASIEESDLFGIVRNGQVKVSFSKNNTDNGLLTGIGSGNVSEYSKNSSANVTEVGSIKTGTASKETEDLIITIGE
ncbi:hypothetical protein [Halorubrum sp. Eb13]|uniref:hypothetical protein n=1 Tax=Halorubrum sp. Eb13 TaxID=1383843 RepID=UPI000B99C173|nr:hypothetical protein [Halorubrum sp. Eb13]OYR45996.1 hypothetical protein DJ75_06715 [Halorubrum sp. Eb13]